MTAKQNDATKHPHIRELLRRITPATRRGRVILWSLLGLYIFWLVIGGLVLPPVVRSELERTMAQHLRATCTVEKVTINPFTLRIRVLGVKVPDASGEGVLFGFRELSIAPSPAALFRLAPSLASARLVEPVVDITYFGEGRFSFSDIVPPSEATTDDKATPVFPFVISDFELVDGSFIFRDEPRGVTHTIADIDFIVPFTSSLDMFRDTPITPSLNATVDGSRMTVAGRLLPFAETQRTEFDIATEDVALEQFKAYLAPFTPLRLEQGKARLELDLLVERLPSGQVELGLGGALRLSDILLNTPDGKKAAALREAELRLHKFTLAERRVELESATVDGLYVKAVRDTDGTVDWQRWISPASGKAAPVTPATSRTAMQNATVSAMTQNATGAASMPASATATDKASAKNPAAGTPPVAATSGSSPEGHSTGKSAAPTADSKAFIVEGAALHLSDATLVWHDASLSGTREIAVTGLDVQIPRFSTGDNKTMPFAITFGLNGQGRFHVDGEATLSPLKVSAAIDSTGLPLAAARPFAGGTPASDIAGSFGGRAKVVFQSSPALQLTVSEGALMVDDLALAAQGKQGHALGVKHIGLKGLAVDYGKQSIRAAVLALTSPSVNLILGDDGLPLLPASAGDSQPDTGKKVKGDRQRRAQGKAGSSTKVESKARGTQEKARRGDTKTADRDWNLVLDSLELDGGTVNITERGAKAPTLQVSDLRVRTGALSPDLTQRLPFDASMRWQKDGQLALKGNVRIRPLDLDLNVKATKVDLAPLDIPLAMSTAMQAGGRLSGDVRLGARERGDDIQMTASGRTQLDDARLRRRGDRRDLIALRRLAVRDFRYGSSPLRVEIGDILLDRPQVFLVLHKDGTTNVLRALDPEGAERRAAAIRTAEKAKAAERAKKQGTQTGAEASSGLASKPVSPAPVAAGETTAEADASGADASGAGADASAAAGARAEAPASLFDRFTLGEVTVRGGKIAFRDERFSPAFDTSLDKVDAAVTGFTMAPESRAEVSAGGTLEGVPVKLTGTLNPVSTPPFADIVFSMEGLDLVPVSPYALQYIAYPVDKGRLTARLQLQTSEWVLSADSKFLLEDIELGDKDSRPDAPDYPVKLGLALLRGLDGNVSIDLPVRGRLDDPNFRLGGVVVQAVMNLMVKVVTSPFALVGSVVRLAGGGGQDMRNVPFEPGRETLSERAEAQLASVAEVLRQRPGLSLEVRGMVDPATDGQGLREVALLRRMQEAKYASLWRGERAKTTVEAITIEDDEYDDLLESVYKDAPFDKPRNVLGLVKDQPREVMEKAFYEHEDVTDDDLTALAQQRARAVRDRLLEIDPALGARLSLAAATGKGKSAAEMLLR